MADTTSQSPVLSHRDADGIVTLTMNRPRFNLLDIEMMEGLSDELSAALADGAAGVVLTGAGSCFCAGLDTKALAAYAADERRRTVELLNSLVFDLYRAPVPTVAAVPGHALAGGLIFALACDRRFVTAEHCKIGLPEVQAGVPFPAVPLLVAEAELGPQLMRVIALGGEPLSPEAAVSHGIFDAVVPEAELAARARQTAAELSGHPAYARIKAQLRDSVSSAAAQTIAYASDPMLDSWL